MIAGSAMGHLIGCYVFMRTVITGPWLNQRARFFLRVGSAERNARKTEWSAELEDEARHPAVPII